MTTPANNVVPLFPTPKPSDPMEGVVRTPELLLVMAILRSLPRKQRAAVSNIAFEATMRDRNCKASRAANFLAAAAVLDA